MFVNDSLWSLHAPLPNTKEVRHQLIASFSDKKPTIEREVKKKAMKN